jgi:CRISPR-associated protein Cas6
VIPDFHDPKSSFFFGPITGIYAGGGSIRLDGRSHLRCRLPADAVGRVLPLADRQLEVAGRSIHLGIPSVSPIQPATALTASLVTFKNSTEPDRFLRVAREKLAILGVSATPHLPLLTAGSRVGQPRRRIVRVAGKSVVGFALLVDELTAAESILLQERGLGGRTRMGCGFFVPFNPRA